jgi:hypothetical protein
MRVRIIGLFLVLAAARASADASLPDGQGGHTSQCEQAMRAAGVKAGMDDAHQHLRRDNDGWRFHYHISDRCGVADDYEALLQPTRAGDERWRGRTSHFDPDRPGRTKHHARRTRNGWEATISTDVGDFPDRTAAFVSAFKGALDRCLADPPAAAASDGMTCTRREWLEVKHAGIKSCRGELCEQLVNDLKNTVFCDGEDARTDENRERCDSRTMTRENPERCERVAPGRYRVHIDCNGWELSYDGRVVSSLRSAGECD